LALSTGIIIAIGPHIPMQCKLLIKPKMKAEYNILF
jgi:hypothetical protein